jgi:hypothetical protein
MSRDVLEIHFLHPGVVKKIIFQVRTTGISINEDIVTNNKIFSPAGTTGISINTTYRRRLTSLEDHPRDSGDHLRSSRRFIIVPSQDNGIM